MPAPSTASAAPVGLAAWSTLFDAKPERPPSAARHFERARVESINSVLRAGGAGRVRPLEAPRAAAPLAAAATASLFPRPEATAERRRARAAAAEAARLAATAGLPARAAQAPPPAAAAALPALRTFTADEVATSSATRQPPRSMLLTPAALLRS